MNPSRSELKLKRMLQKIAMLPLLRKKIQGRPIGLFLLPYREMQTIKRRFLPREKGPANVLAFPEPLKWPHPESSKAPLGEIYLNTKYARGKAVEALLLHGLLHLLGYEHKKKDDRIKMEKIEKELIGELVN